MNNNGQQAFRLSAQERPSAFAALIKSCAKDRRLFLMAFCANDFCVKMAGDFCHKMGIFDLFVRKLKICKIFFR